jgi:hypothetical protein
MLVADARNASTTGSRGYASLLLDDDLPRGGDRKERRG